MSVIYKKAYAGFPKKGTDVKSQIHYPGRTRWFVLSMGLGLMASLQAQISDAFNPGMSGPVSALAVQTDGRIIVGGAGGFGGGFQGRGLARFYDDGTLDQSLAATIVPPPPGGAANVNAVAI